MSNAIAIRFDVPLIARFGAPTNRIPGAHMTARLPQRGDPQFFDELRTRLYTSVLSDVLDDVGVRDQAMPSRIRPLDDQLVLVGLARTGLFRDVYHVAEHENPYELE